MLLRALPMEVRSMRAMFDCVIAIAQMCSRGDRICEEVGETDLRVRVC
jgi:hypothetical protein